MADKASPIVGFGGFTPNGFSDVEESTKQFIEMKASYDLKKKRVEQDNALKRARMSSKRRMTDSEGTTWTYATLDDMAIRILGVATHVKLLEIPVEIDDLPVWSIGSDIFPENKIVEEIVCPDSVTEIAPCAFRSFLTLKKIRFPRLVSEYSSSWLQHCEQVEQMVLPGQLKKARADIFDLPALKELCFGPALAEVEPGAFQKTNIAKFELDPQNTTFTSDGDALYTSDGQEMVALVRPVHTYTVRAGCKKLAKKCCFGIELLENINLPDSLEELGEFSLSHTGLKECKLPSSLRILGEKAFYACASLKTVELNDGLEEIRSSAFEDSGLIGITVPPSVEQIGTSVTKNSRVVHSGSGATFSVDEASPHLWYDGEGGLYRREESGLHFVQLIDEKATKFQVAKGTRWVDPYSFAYHNSLEQVVVPEGVESIGRSAFRVCTRLRNVELPESLREISQEAFFDTSLESIALSKNFEKLGKDALVTRGAHHLEEPPSLREITVAPENEIFYVESGILCRRESRGDVAVVFNDSVEDVVIPGTVVHIDEHAFNNMRNVKTISIGPNLKTIGTAGLTVWSKVSNIHVQLEEPIEGRTTFDLQFPDTPRTAHEISIALGGSSWVNVPDMYRHYDNCLANAHDYNMRDDEGLSASEQAKLMVARLKDPILLVEVNRSLFNRILKLNIVEICVDAARHDNRALVNDLVDFGYLHADNIEEVILAVGKLQDAAMSGHLLELKRRRFGHAAIDFDL